MEEIIGKITERPKIGIFRIIDKIIDIGRRHVYSNYRRFEGIINIENDRRIVKNLSLSGKHHLSHTLSGGWGWVIDSFRLEKIHSAPTKILYALECRLFSQNEVLNTIFTKDLGPQSTCLLSDEKWEVDGLMTFLNLSIIQLWQEMWKPEI